MTKYRTYVKRMLDTNKKLFEDFRKIHDKYALDEEAWQEKFNKEGEKVLLLVHEWEDKLCRQSEKAGYGSFTTSLAEKFQAELKKEFPLIDHVGILVKKTPSFNIRRIRLG
jgi:gamma-glutamylcysteine synthetase